jgi:hypothetical protein
LDTQAIQRQQADATPGNGEATPDGDLVGFDGTHHLTGRQQIAAHNQRLFDH